MPGMRLLAIFLLTLLTGLPLLARAQDDSEDMSPPATEEMVDAPVDEAAPVDEVAPAEDMVPADEAPPATDVPSEQPAPPPAQPTVVPAPQPAPSLPPIPGVQDVQVTLRDDFTITVSPGTVRPGPTRFIVTNAGRMSHGLGIIGAGTEQFVTPGITLTSQTVLSARTYMLYCPMADHRDRGMTAQLVVQ